jgi:hypothetical protein
MPMLYAIRDYYEATGDARVIPFFTQYFQYQNSTIESQPLSSWGKSRAGDNIEIVFWLYNRTGDAFLLELADKLKNQAYNWTDIFTNNLFNQFETDFQPKHNVNIPQAMKMPAIYFQKSQSHADRDACIFGCEHLLCEHGQPHGMQSGNEMLAGKSSVTGLELCSVVEQMQTDESIQMILGDASIGDRLEKLAFNALPGALTGDIKGLQYYQQANQVISKFGYYGFAQAYDNGNMPGPYSGYGCCRFNFHTGWPYLVKTMWAATADNGLAAMTYGPCTVTALVENGVEATIRETTDYPFDEKLVFEISVSKAVRFPLKFRIPDWCKSPQIKVNGIVQNGVESGAFFTINRTWNNNDIVSLDLPMSVQMNEEVNNSVSIQRGPLIYSLKIEENRLIRNDYGNGFTECEVFPSSAWNYGLIIDKNSPGSFIQVNKRTMPENPYIQSTTPITLTVSARKLSAWTYSHNDRIAIDPPYSPVVSSEPVEQVTFVPYGSETLRATCLPYIGVKEAATSSFTDNFSDVKAGWVQYGGSFYVKNGEYVATHVEASHPCSKSVYSGADFSDFTYDAQVKVGSDGDGGLMFRASRFSFGPDDYSGYYVGISSSGKKVELGKAEGTWTSLKTVGMNITADRWYQVRVAAKGTNIKIYIDDMITPKIDFNDASFASGAIGVRAYRALASWDNISVTSLTETGISTSKASDTMHLYPNPATTNLSIIIPQSGYMSVYDSVGKQVFSGNVASGATTLNTGDYEAGIYFVKLVGNEGTTACNRFIKQGVRISF